jgi:hypothetical protein
MRTPLAIVLVFGLAALEAGAQQACPSSRICSTLGFSFEPPAAPTWTTEFERNAIQFFRVLDPAVVSMHAGAVEGKMSENLGSPEELVAFVRRLKSKWGPEGRYANVKETYVIEAANDSCVRYMQHAEDKGANNRGRHSFLPIQNVGRFCLHPRQRMHAVDLYYSVRSVPGYGTAELQREGEALLRSLEFSEP